MYFIIFTCFIYKYIEKNLLSGIFTEKFVFQDGKVASTPFSVPVQVLINANKVFGRSGKKKEVENDLLLVFASLTAQSCNRIISLQFSECPNFKVKIELTSYNCF